MNIDFKDLLKFGALAAGTYATGGLLAPALGSMGLGATAAGIGGNAIAGSLVGKLANPEMSRDQMLQNMAGGAIMGAGLNGLGSVMGKFGADAATGAATGMTAPGAMATTAAGAPTEALANYSLSAGGAEGLIPGSMQPGSIAPQLGQGVVSQAPGATNPMAGLQRGVDQPGAFADYMATQGRGDAAKALIGAGMMDFGQGPQDPEDPTYSGEYTIHDVYGTPLYGGGRGSEGMHLKARKVRFAEGGNVMTYASGGRLVDPKKTAPKGTDTVPAAIDGVQPARLDSGEYVMTKKAVKNAGGPKAMDKLHAQLKRGGIGRAGKV